MSSLARKPATFLREHTQQPRDHIAAMARLTDQYVAALKRAEANYFDGVRRITDALTASTESAAGEGFTMKAETEAEAG